MHLQRRTKLLIGAALALGLVIPAADALASPSTGSGQGSTETVAPTTTTVKGATSTTATTVKGATSTTAGSTTVATTKSAAKTSTTNPSTTRKHFRVVAGGFRTRAQATKQVARIKKAGQSGFVVVRSGRLFLAEDRGLAKADAVRIVKVLKSKGLTASIRG